jgi:cytochrome c oxidase subunit 2
MNGDASVFSVMQPATPEAEALHTLALVLFGGGTIIFLGVMALLAASVLGGGRPVRTRRWVLGGGVAFPVLVLSALLVFAAVRTTSLVRAAPADALVVSMTGHMWWWEIRYRDPRSGATVTTANELRVPVGRPVRLALETADVIHSVWFPALHGKVDMVPGRVTHLVFTVNEAGRYRGQCAEYCGDQHAKMAMHLVAEPAEDFDAWLARAGDAPAAPTDPRLARGRDAFVELQCGSCHAVRGLAETTGRGPDLTHVGGRAMLGAGLLPTNEGTLAGWIADPAVHKPGVRMPAYGRVEPERLQALAAWLATLR